MFIRYDDLNFSDEFFNPFNMTRAKAPSPVKYAVARVNGGSIYPRISGTVAFKSVPGGTQVTVNIRGLPNYQAAVDNKSPIGPFGFHIHNGVSCEVGTLENQFAASMGHFNPTNQPHGNHAGDFPVLFSNHGVARMTFYTDKFNVKDVIGKTVIIHENPDDYRTQPTGNSGRRIACGVIVKSLKFM